MIQLVRPLTIFDLETTGLDIVFDRIIEFGFIKIFPDGTIHTDNWRINPEMHIPEEATKVHGITDDDVKNEPTFLDRADKIREVFNNSDVGGYNSNHFDIPMLVEKFLDIGIEIFSEDTKFIDVQTIFKKKEERTLKAAVKYFLNEEFEDAHKASIDAFQTQRVLFAQIERYPDIGNTVEELAKFSEYENSKRVDFAGKLVMNDKGVVCYNIGKAKGVPVLDDPGFGEWMLTKDFALDTKRKLIKIFEANAEADKQEEDLFYTENEIEDFERKEIDETINNDDLPF